MLKINTEKLVRLSVTGKVDHPIAFKEFNIGANGEAFILPGIGGITYNIKIGDKAFGWQGDHVEPGVSIRNDNKEANTALNTFACIGNEAVILTGDAKGSKGYVTGKHGGVDHILISFDQDVLEKMSADETILIKSYGQGLELIDHPSVHVMNIDPVFFDKFITEEVNGTLRIPVKAVVPGVLMGSGLGSATAYSGDCDIMTADTDEIRKHKIDELCLGDIVFIENYDSRFGRGYCKGTATTGVIIHGDSKIAGHGPGITTIMTGKNLLPALSKDASIVKLFE